MHASTRFDVTRWSPVAADEPEAGPELSRVEIEKVFRDGDLTGHSAGEGLFCGMSAPQSGAGYLVSERVTGTLNGRAGSFVIQHGGLMGPGVPPHTFGNVVPGSGTGELAGIAGTVTIDQDEAGTHRMVLDVTLPA